jgi:hypothetical protein
MKKITYKEFINLKLDLYWELWWWLDHKTTVIYKWLIEKEKDRPSLK